MAVETCKPEGDKVLVVAAVPNVVPPAVATAVPAGGPAVAVVVTPVAYATPPAGGAYRVDFTADMPGPGTKRGNRLTYPYLIERQNGLKASGPGGTT